MARRKGVNTRKRYQQRKKKAFSRFKEILPKVVVVAAVIAIGAGIYCSGVIDLDAIVGKLDASPLFSVRKIAVRGTQRLQVADIMKRCGIEETTKIYHVERAAVSAALSADPWIEKVRCVKKWWGGVIIEITDRIPVAMVNSGEIMLVDRSGAILPMEPGRKYELPLVSGLKISIAENGKRSADSRIMEKVTGFIDEAVAEDPNWFKKITQFDVRDSGSIHCRVAGSPVVVAVGYDSDAKQFRNLRYLLEVLEQNRETAGTIDLRYQNIAFVRREPRAGKTDAGIVNN